MSVARSRTLLVCSLVFVTAALQYRRALAGIVQVQVLHRHGARQHLEKSVDNPGDESGGSLLLKEGSAQLRALGKAFRDRYYSPQGAARDSAIADVSAEYTGSADIWALSSDLDRTLASSRAFLAGLYPDGESDRVPTHEFGAINFDWVLRSYALCPKFRKLVLDFLDSDTYTKQAEIVESAGILKRVAKDAGEDPKLANAYNVYDKYVLARGPYDDANIDLPSISDEEFKAVKDAADWTESNKYASHDVAQNWVSGPVLSEMIRQSEAMQSKSGNKHRVVEYSGHYPLLLGVFSALRMSKLPAGDVPDITKAIPGFGAALVWELYSDGNVQFRWSNGDGNATLISIPCGDDSTTTKCSLSSLKSRLEKDKLLKTPSDFCGACGTDSNNSALCTSTRASSDDSVSRSSGSKVAAGVGGAVAGLILGLACGFLIARRASSSKQDIVRSTQISAIVDPSNTDSSGAQDDSPFDNGYNSNGYAENPRV